MKKSMILIWIILPLITVSSLTPMAEACTTFCIQSKDQLVFGRNYDWNIGVGLVMINKKDIQKRAFLTSPGEPVEWVSRYGSISFNQYGRELTTGGMNEAGLVVEQMWLSETRYPEPDKRPTLRELSWVQYQLDTSRTVDDVIASDARIRISPDSVTLHFLVCDKEGKVATIEFLNGKMVAHKGDDLPVTALANNCYSDSLDYVKRFQCYGGDKIKPESTGSLDRFSGAALGIKEYEKDEKENIIEHAFTILDRVSQKSFTQWSIVYDVKNLAIQFKTTAAPTIKTLQMNDFDFSHNTLVRVLDIDTPKAGDAAPEFVDYTLEINKKLVLDAWKGTSFLKDTPDHFLNLVAGYPETLTPKAE